MAGCGIDEICYVGVADPRFSSMLNHCYISLCDGVFNLCRMGSDVGLANVLKRIGTCVTLDDRGGLLNPDAGTMTDPLGQCLDSGNVAVDFPCDSGPRQLRGANCGEGLVCVPGNPGSPGRCATLCDPQLNGSNCPAGQGCFDRSVGHTLYDPQTDSPFSVFSATNGYCRRGVACVVTHPGGCPSGQGCLPTNPVRSVGFCSVDGPGDRAPGQSCVPEGGAEVPDSSERCAEGNLCDPAAADADAGVRGRCRPFCELNSACPGGSTCTPFVWANGPNGPDYTQEYGVCR
jgi:hypothetical protein